MSDDRTYTVFDSNRMIVSSDLKTMLLKTKKHLDGGKANQVLIFEDQTGKQLDFDFRGTPDEVWKRISSHPHFIKTNQNHPLQIGPGRPKLGVISREVTLLPRHWDWLEEQPSGISAALRRLVEEARKCAPDKERARAAQAAAGKIMTVLAGNFAGFEEAARALYANNTEHFKKLINSWPKDIRKYLERLFQHSIHQMERRPKS
jgi:hypothetical protein